jgi:hypothetical protein
MNICVCNAKNTYKSDGRHINIMCKGKINMKITKNEYKKLAEKTTPIGKILKDCLD